MISATFDCAGIHVYEEDLRESTRKKRKRRSRTKRRPGERRKSGKKRARRRQAALGTVFTQHRHSRTLEDLPEGKAPDAPRPEFKTSMATICGHVDDIVERVFAEASRRDPQRNKSWVALVDGDPKLEKAIKRTAVASSKRSELSFPSRNVITARRHPRTSRIGSRRCP